MSALRRNRTRSTAQRLKVFPNVESLESRLALSGAHATVAPPRPGGTISGQILNDVNGRGIGQVKVELIDADGQVVAATRTGPRGRYAFRVKEAGPYVVHAAAPPRWLQTSPTFDSLAPTGAYAISPSTGKPYTGASWNYRTGNNDPANGPVGPGAWSTIAPAGRLPFESPINLKGASVDLGQYLAIHYQDATPKAIIDNGAQIQGQFDPSASDSIVLNGQVYELSQFHYHDAAENQVDGYTYPMEEHFVNVSASGAETVIAVFLQLGPHNAALQPILDAATAHLATPNSTTTIETPIHFAGLLPTNLQGWFYEGSLTTPPLSQTVNWLVLSTPITLDAQQLRQYEAVADHAGFLPNNRPIQPTDGRQVNQFDIDVDVQGSPIQDANFTFTPRNLAQHQATRLASRPSGTGPAFRRHA